LGNAAEAVGNTSGNEVGSGVSATHRPLKGGVVGNEPDGLFFRVLDAKQLPRPAVEVRFAPPRRWRFDYAWVDHRVALEVDGGVWTRGRHLRGKGFLGDMEKMNRATVLGWRVVRTTPDQLVSQATLDMLHSLLTSDSHA
jgi:hypothetical protein